LLMYLLSIFAILYWAIGLPHALQKTKGFH
jgi:hypothetical protein